MSTRNYANQEAVEGAVGSTVVEVTLNRRSRSIEIINDDASQDLEYRFNTAENYATLKPLEAFSADFIARKIYLNSPSMANVNYRIRALG